MSTLNRLAAIVCLIAACVVGPFYGAYAHAAFLVALAIFNQLLAMESAA